MKTLLFDLRYAFRGMRRAPLYAGVVIITLGLGIGANTAMFSVVRGVLLSPLPYDSPDDLVILWNQFPGTGEMEMGHSPAEVSDWAARKDVFAGVGTVATGEQNMLWTLTENGETERYEGAWVSASLFDVFGVDASLGRTFVPGEDTEGKADVVVLSDAFWRRRFAADPTILGRRLVINGEPVSVVGIMAPGFHTDLNVSNARNVDFWLPWVPGEDWLLNRRARGVNLVARLAPGVTLEQAQATTTIVGAAFAQEYPDAYQDEMGYGIAAQPLHERIVGDVELPLLVLLGTVAVVLLIASTNVANLLLVRAEGRQREVAVRTALGASRATVTKLYVLESVLLTVFGGLLGVGLAYGAVGLLRAFNPGGIPRMELVAIDSGVLLFTVALIAGTGLIMGLVPGLHAARADVTGMLRDGGRGATSMSGSRARRVFVVSQIALAVLLVIGAGLLTKSFRNLANIQLGIEPESVLSMRMDFPTWQYGEIGEVFNVEEQLLERVQALPGVQSAALAHAEHPLRLNGRWYFDVEGEERNPDAPRQLVGIRVVSPDYLETVRVPLLEGRTFNEFDREGVAPVILINQALAERRFPGESPVGRRLKIATADMYFEIIGVIGNVKNEGIREDVRETMLFPLANPAFASDWRRHMTLHVRGASPSGLMGPVRETIRAVDGRLTVYNIEALDDVVSETVAASRFVMMLTGLFAGLALLLAGVGVYGVISYSVAQRTQEIGVRLALGAGPSKVIRLVLHQGLGLALVGIFVGLVTAYMGTRLLAGILYGVSATDPWTFAGVAVALVMISLLATFLLARRASAIEPVVALRQE